MKKKLTLCYVPPYFPPRWGGLESVVYNLSTRMAKKGHKIFVVTTEYPEEKVNVSNINLTRLKVDFKIFNTPIAFSLFKTLEKINVDLYHLQAYPSYFADVASIVARMKGKPYVLQWHIDPRQCDPYKTFKGKLITDIYFFLYGNKLLNSASKIITPSELYKQFLIKNSKIDPEKIVVIPNGIDTNLFKPHSKIEKDKKIVLFVGRINPQKNLHMILEIWKDVEKEIPDAELWIVGKHDEPKYHEYIQKLASKLKKIKFLGEVNQKKLPLIYSKASLLVFPSLYESFGNVALEAMSCGIPVISSPVGIIPNIIDNCGILINVNDKKKWEKNIYNLLNDKKKLSKFGKNARKTIINNFSWEKNIKEIENLYCDIINKRR